MKYAYHTKWCNKWYRGGANNHPHYSMIRAPTMSLSHHVWYAHWVSPFTGLNYWTEVFFLFWTRFCGFWFTSIFDIWRSQIKLVAISVILQCQQYNDFMTVVVLLAFSNALVNKVMIMASQIILGIV